MKKIYYLPVFLLLFWSCSAPRMVTQITPEAAEGHYAMGREYIFLESDHIGVELGYDGIQSDNLVFDFVVHNTTADTLTILPGDFYYVVLDSANDHSSPYTPWMAVHPDKVLMHYDKTLEERKEEKGMNSFLGFLEAGIGLVANTTAFIATENPGYIVDAVFNTLGTVDYYVTQDRQISNNISVINQEKEIVKEEIFRVANLPPGKVVSGYVYFPRNRDTDYYMFCFPVEDQLFQFVYKQRLVYHYY